MKQPARRHSFPELSFLGTFTGFIRSVAMLAWLSLPLQAQITSFEDLQLLLTHNSAAPGPSTQNQSPQGTGNPNVFYANPGAWGRLRCAYIYLEAPKQLIENFPLPNTQPRWGFPEALRNDLPALFQRAGLPEIVSQSLLDPKTSVTSEGMIFVFPRGADIEAMSPETRSFLYTELSKYQINEYYVDPVLVIGQTVKEWYRTSKLRPELIQKIDQLSYKRGETIAFSDIPYLLSFAQTDSEARTIFKAMTRTRGLMVKIEADHDTKIDEVVGYWTLGIGLRRKDVEPLLQSIIDTDGIEALPLSHMLPALVRKLLYTYPSLDMGKNGILPDCHWTSLNFFNYDPHEYLLDSRLATSAVLEKFEPVNPPYKYGDILFFLSNATGDAYHSCVYLADNLVFTKNGRNLLSPWLIMKREDVEKIYLYRGDGKIQGFRRKQQAE
jgi:hypothetical protein